MERLRRFTKSSKRASSRLRRDSRLEAGLVVSFSRQGKTLVATGDIDHGGSVRSLGVDIDEAVGSDRDASSRINLAGLWVAHGVKLNFCDGERIVFGADVLRFLVFREDVFGNDDDAFAVGRIECERSEDFAAGLPCNVDMALCHGAEDSHALVVAILGEDLFELSAFCVSGPRGDLDADGGAAARPSDGRDDGGSVDSSLLSHGGISESKHECE